MNRALALSLTVLGLVPTPGFGHKHSSPAERFFQKRCGNGSVTAVKACIHRAALHWGADYRTGLYIAHRESRFNPSICNYQGSGACGLFQWMPGSFASTPYGRESRFSAKYSSLAWAWAWTHGWQSAWGF